MAFAYLLTDDGKYMDGVIGGMDYILGRNPMDYSYVTGYGSHTTEYPHHRYWSWLIDDTFPKAPCGVMAGGPNSGMQDPWVQGSGWKKGQIAPQQCYLDHIEAWCVNECTINWNASLAWVTGFLAEENGGIVVGETGRSAGIVNDGGKDESDAKVTTAKTDKSGKKVTTTKASKSDDDSEEGTSGVWIAVAIIVAVVAFAGVILAIALMIFIYKMVKLRSESGGKLPKSDEKKKD